MIKGRSKIFAPKKIIRNSQHSQPNYPTPSPTQADVNRLESSENQLPSVEIAKNVIENTPLSQPNYPTPSPSQVDANNLENNGNLLISVQTPKERPQERLQEISQENPQERSQEISQEKPQETPHKIPQHKRHEIPQELSNELPQEIQKTGKAPNLAKTTPRVKRKYNKKTPVVESEVLDNGTLDDLKKKIQKKKARGKRKRRESTPEGAEMKKIDPSVITMQDLCRDLRIGKKSRNHDEIMGRLARVKQDAIKAKMKRDNPEIHEFIRGGTDDNNNLEIKRQAEPSLKSDIIPPPVSTAGPRIRIVDGQIVTDEQSLHIDRHKIARENVWGDEEVVEENDFTRVITCGNYLKRERSQHWDVPSNELFWRGLRMFGTDFEMIAKMFPNRSRRQIKLKFNAEEKSNPQKVNRVLMGIKTEEIDLDEFQRLGNLELEDLAVIKAEQAQIEKEQSERLKVALENT